jgi:hypothetical protein
MSNFMDPFCSEENFMTSKFILLWVTFELFEPREVDENEVVPVWPRSRFGLKNTKCDDDIFLKKNIPFHLPPCSLQYLSIRLSGLQTPILKEWS